MDYDMILVLNRTKGKGPGFDYVFKMVTGSTCGYPHQAAGDFANHA